MKKQKLWPQSDFPTAKSKNDQDRFRQKKQLQNLDPGATYSGLGAVP